jgi:hypothetical protein
MNKPAGTPGGSGPLTRRELLSAAARWTVPTVVTLTLGARVLQAAVSCPPCTKKSAGKCKACTVSQMLNCQCEPCLGPPYCTGGPTPSVMRPGPGLGAFPGTQRPGQGGGQLPGDVRRRLYEAPRLGRGPYERLNEPLYRDPFGSRDRFANPFRDRSVRERSLYERLRGDSLDTRRIP